jgi:hypothetical protein
MLTKIASFGRVKGVPDHITVSFIYLVVIALAVRPQLLDEG